MQTRSLLLAVLLVSAICSFPGSSAQAFDLEEYARYLDGTRDLTMEGLLGSREPFGPYRYELPAVESDPAYLSEIDHWLHLTSGERTLLQRNGFMVSERYRGSFGGYYNTIYRKDLPIFVSTDAILHAIHKSYDDLLTTAELQCLYPTLEQALWKMQAGWPALNERYRSNPAMGPSLADIDVYTTVALGLLSGGWQVPSRGGNDAMVGQIMALAREEKPARIALFSNEERSYDFSQLKPRGHYVNEEYPELADYFRSMMWLGRTEFRLSSPRGNSSIGVEREIVDARLMMELVRDTGADAELQKIDQAIRAMVGPPDNVTLSELDRLSRAIQVESADQLLLPAYLSAFEQELADGTYTGQAILSQIIACDIMRPEECHPPYAFLLMGQRFIVDSFLTGQVVWPYAVPSGPNDPIRILPDPLDVLYGIGNDDVLPLLRDELALYGYAPNLAAVRYLIDGYEPDFWRSNLYNAWLQAIRTLSLSGRQPGVPPFMTTGAWQQEKMNTQLASWAEIRHDNLLYAKQSYTGVPITCSFPCTYIEPIPVFYEAMGQLADDAGRVFSAIPGMPREVVSFFGNMRGVMNRLHGIAEKELSGGEFTEGERRFLGSVLYTPEVPCEESGTGWYRSLFFNGDMAEDRDALIADVHTNPDPEGPRILHAATGYPELGIFIVPEADDRSTAYVGPVGAFHEYVTRGFNRLTDAEWAEIYKADAPFRPDWTYVYLADRTGAIRNDGRRLVASPDTLPPPPEPQHPDQDAWLLDGQDGSSGDGEPRISFVSATPNPTQDETLVSFRIEGRGSLPVRIAIFDVRGGLVRELYQGTRERAMVHVRWDGRDDRGRPAPQGVYYIRVTAEGVEELRKLTLVH